MSKHTPGPWHVDPEYPTSVQGRDAGPGTPMICEMFTSSQFVSPAEQRANARLIAAAPELLSVLIQAVESSGFSLSGPTDSRAAEHNEPAWVCNARAAIAKAEGSV